MIGIVDIGLGNVGSIVNMCNYLSFECKRVRSTEDLEGLNKLILPGVGSFDSGVLGLKRSGLFDAIIEFAKNPKNYVLGICLGMQLLMEGSEEGELDGLNLVPGKLERFKTKKVPHMGWNQVVATDVNPFFSEEKFYKFYFVHSYYASYNNEYKLCTTCFEGVEFTSAITNKLGNVFGVQFHPEKSHQFGLNLFTKFYEL